MKHTSFLTLVVAALTITACSNGSSPRSEQLLTEWDFTLSEDSVNCPTEGWEAVTVPHDWAIAQPFDRKYDLQTVAVVQNGENTATEKTGRSGGLPWMGIGWYKTTISTPDTSKVYTLLFDGAMSHATVFVNGQEAGYWPYGYNSFHVDITPYVTGPETEVTVRLHNKAQSSRWYPGGGLFRNVHLITTNRIHVPVWGSYITTPVVCADSAIVELQVIPINCTTNTRVEHQVLFKGKKVAVGEDIDAQIVVRKPHLWSPESPELYTLVSTVKENGKVVDRYETRFGFRTISYTAENGFQLNGQTRKFQGVCMHHDLGPLGAAVHPDALRHQLTILKDMGCDAIRTSHNMPAPELVQLCEEMGFMVMVEPFDVWDWGKTDNDYHIHFKEWAERDITNMVLNYRNSPAVVMWSSGNEVWNQTFEKGYETVNWLQKIFHQLDPTRPVTCGMDQAWAVIYNGFGAAVEIPGFNYRTHRYVEAYEHLPQKMILGSETASTVSSRGVYKTPAVIQPDAIYEDGQCSGYDMEYCSWSGLPEQDFALMDDYNWTLGQFVWTGFDYLGEPSPYDTDAWPSHSSYFGIVDLASLPKDRYYLYRSQWNKQDATLHLLPHWNWSEGDIVPVFCYTSYPSVELFVNGESQGRLRFATAEEAQRMKDGETIEGVSAIPPVGDFQVAGWGSAPRPELLPRYRLMWPNVRWQKGEIKVVAYDAEGKAVAEQVVRTTGEPDHLQAEWVNKNEGAKELRYVTVSVRDKDDNLCPDACPLVTIEAEECTFVGAANGDARCLDPMQQPQMHAFAGQCTFIVKGKGTATFSAEGLNSATIKL